MLNMFSSYIKYIIAGLIFGAMVAVVAYVLNIFKKQKKQAKAGAQPGQQQPVEAPGGDDLSLLFREADNKLAQARLGKGARVSSLPAFLLMGDGGSTKTTVVVQSGLDPELLAGQVFQNTDIVPTRTGNLWFARGAVFVEAGGSLVADNSKWSQLVKKFQPKASVVGKGEQAPRAAIVCFDCEVFTQPGSIDIAAQRARLLRARLGEISQSLGINLPVYVLFTKIDRLPFFTDYVRNLSNEEATQVFGVTLPMIGGQSAGVYAEQETARLTWNFDLLFRALADSRTEFLPRETDGTKLPGAYEFPREFRKIKPVMAQFLVDLCRPAQLTVGPFLRGFYFTGVRPVIINEGAPVAPAFQQQQRGAAYEAPAGATGIFQMGGRQQPAQQQAVAAAQQVVGSRKVPQWMFLTRLFTEVLLADKSAMGAAGASTKTSSGRRWLFIAAASLCFIFSVFFLLSFLNNRSLETQLKDAGEGVSTPLAAADLASVEELNRLEKLRVVTKQLADYRDGHPFAYGWFLYEGDNLYPEARRLYCARFQQLLLRQTQAAIVQDEKALPPKQQPGSPEYNPTYDALKAYLITTSHHQYADKTWLPPVLMNLWKHGRNATPEQTRLAQAQFDFYAAERKDDDFCAAAPDQKAVGQARQYLLSFTGTDHVYAVMLAEAAKGNPPVNYNRQFPEYVKVVADPYEVPGAFTKGGWNFMKDKIPQAEKYFTGDEWVLGTKSAATTDAQSLRQEIRTRYNNDYLKHWRAYVNSGKVQNYKDIADAAAKLNQTASAQSPLLALLCLGAENTAVDDPNVANVFDPLQKVVPAPCSAQYYKPANQGYMNALVTLQASLEAIPDKQKPDDASANASKGKASEARIATNQLGNTFRPDADTQAAVKKLLLDPITNAEAVLKGIGPDLLNAGGKSLCSEMNPTMRKFPFTVAKDPKNNPPDATLEDVNHLFAPKTGSIWKFWEESLQKYVSRYGEPVKGAAVEITPRFQGFLRNVAAFTDAAYPGGIANPKFSYQLRGVVEPEYYEKVSLNVDGQPAEFGPGAAAKPFTWPGPTPGFQLTLKPKGDPGTIPYPPIPGLWGLFHYAAESQKVGTVYEMEDITPSGRKFPHPAAPNQVVKAKLEIIANPQIFDRNYFSGLSCVAEVAKQ